MKSSCGLAVVSLLAGALTAQSPLLHPVTFHDVAPILHRNCAPCHHQGGSGPFNLLSYQDVGKRARQIAVVTKSRYMPPWLPEPGYGHFAEERRLTADEIRLIQDWVAQGAVEGKPAPLPPPSFHEKWELGEPDLVLQMPKPYVLPARGDHGRDVFRNFIIRVPVETTRYVRAIEFRPGNPQIFHHANILVDRGGTSRSRETADGMGFEGMDLEIESETFDPDGYFLFWKPGSAPSSGTDGLSWRVDPGTDLVLNLHMRPDGKPETVQVSVGVYFAEKPPTQFPMLLQLEHDRAIDIPPGDKAFVVTDEFMLPLAVQVLGVYPHAHYLGKDLQGYAILPNGDKRWLVRIKDWNLDWQGVFRYAAPMLLPKGSTIHMQWTYDNSSANVRNPNDPPRRVTAGNQASDEMGHLWLQVLPVTDPGVKADPRIVLQEALMRHRLRNDPEDYIARYNLGSVLQIRGQLDESAAEYRRVLRLRPDDPVVRNSLGTVLKLQGKDEDAIAEFREALRLRPDYADAEYNLGRVFLGQAKLDQAMASFDSVIRSHPENADAHYSRALVLQVEDKTEQAIQEYREILRLRPGYTDAEYNLGRALLSQGKVAEAIANFHDVLRTHPGDADAHHSLGVALAEQGDLRGAQSEFQEVLRIDPRDADAHNEIGIVLARQENFIEALRQFEEALRLNPQLEGVGENLKRVQAQLNRHRMN